MSEGGNPMDFWKKLDRKASPVKSASPNTPGSKSFIQPGSSGHISKGKQASASFHDSSDATSTGRTHSPSVSLPSGKSILEQLLENDSQQGRARSQSRADGIDSGIQSPFSKINSSNSSNEPLTRSTSAGRLSISEDLPPATSSGQTGLTPIGAQSIGRRMSGTHIQKSRSNEVQAPIQPQAPAAIPPSASNRINNESPSATFAQPAAVSSSEIFDQMRREMELKKQQFQEEMRLFQLQYEEKLREYEKKHTPPEITAPAVQAAAVPATQTFSASTTPAPVSNPTPQLVVSPPPKTDEMPATKAQEATPSQQEAPLAQITAPSQAITQPPPQVQTIKPSAAPLSVAPSPTPAATPATPEEKTAEKVVAEPKTPEKDQAPQRPATLEQNTTENNPAPIKRERSITKSASEPVSAPTRDEERIFSPINFRNSEEVFVSEKAPESPEPALKSSKEEATNKLITSNVRSKTSPALSSPENQSETTAENDANKDRPPLQRAPRGSRLLSYRGELPKDNLYSHNRSTSFQVSPSPKQTTSLTSPVKSEKTPQKDLLKERPSGAPITLPKECYTEDIFLELTLDLAGSLQIDRFDLTCTAFDESRQNRETVSKFQLENSAKIGTVSEAVVYFGDKYEGDSEAVKFLLNTSKLVPSVRTLIFAITCSQGDFSKVNGANLTMKVQEKQVFSCFVDCTGDHTGMLLCALSKIPEVATWQFVTLSTPCSARYARDLAPHFKKHLHHLIPSEFESMEQGDSVEIGHDIGDIFLEFGWKLGRGDIEVHACCMMFDMFAHNYDDVYFVNKTSQDHSIKLVESTPETEKYAIKLSRVFRRVNVLVGTICIYASDAEASSQISNAFCRLVDARNGNEITKFQLAHFGQYPTRVMCKISRKSIGEPNAWKMLAVGAQLQQTNVVDIIQPVQDNFAENWSEMYRWTKTRVFVVQAKDLTAVNKKGNYSNPFVTIVDNTEEKPMKTPTQPKTINPSWDFGFETGMVGKILFEVWHERDRFGKDCLGEVLVDIQALPIGTQQDLWFDITPKDKKVPKKGGSLRLKILKIK